MNPSWTVRLVLLAGLVLSMLAIAACTLTERLGAQTTIRPNQVWGYVPEFNYANGWARAEANSALLTGVSLFQYHLDADGDLIGYPGTALIPAWAAERGLQVVPMIANNVNSRWDPDVVSRVLSDPQRQRHHIDNIVSLVVDNGFPRVELDYETLNAADRDRYAAFVEELAAALHARGKQLAIAVHAKTSEPGDWSGPQAQDWSRIGAAVDWVILLTYDQDPQRPGPIAGLSWTREVLRYARTQIPPEKIIQGIPSYGYEWSPGAPVKDRTYGQAWEIARSRGIQPRRGPVDRHLLVEYTDGEARNVLWLADAETVNALLAIGREVGVAGYALWHLGSDDPELMSQFRGIAR